MDINFYYVDLNYLDQLKTAEVKKRGFTCVPNTEYHSGNKKFFYGTVLSIHGVNYFVPVSSKTNHNKQDDLLICIKDKIKPIAGSLRFQYMIPVPSACIKPLIRDELPSMQQRERIKKELAFCRKNKDLIASKAQNVYNRVVGKVNSDLAKNSCDFVLLEQAYISYCISNELPINNHQIKSLTETENLYNDIIRVLKKHKEILESNPPLNTLFQQTRSDYLKSKGIDISDRLLEDLENALIQRKEINEILNLNTQLKKDYIAAKKEYNEKTININQPSASASLHTPSHKTNSLKH